MQVLIFNLDQDRYGLNTRAIVRVLPLMEFKRIPQTPDYVAGLMNYQGASVPVIDLLQMSCGMTSPPCFDTRILLVDYPTVDGRNAILGLVAQHVIGIERMDDDLFSDTGVSAAATPYLGKVAATPAGIVQLVELNELISPEVHAILFQPTETSASC